MNKLGKIEVDYLNICWQYCEQNEVEIVPYILADYSVLKITFYNAYKTVDEKNSSFWNKELRKVKKRIRKYDLNQCAIHMDKDMERIMGKEGTAYYSRKQEFLYHRYEISKMLREGRNPGRNRVLIILDNNMLNFHELEMVLLTIKDTFEDITVFTTEKSDIINRVCEFLQDEWGVYITKVEMIRDLENVYDATVALVACWKEEYIKLCYGRVYLLSKEEEPLSDFSLENRSEVSIFSGMDYVCHGKPVPNQMAVDLIYQKKENNKKTVPSSVAICELK